MSGPLSPLIYGVVVPAVLAAALLSTVLVVGRRLKRESGSRVGVALGLGLGSLAGLLGIFLPAWPPLDVTDRIPFLMGVALIAALWESVRPASWSIWLGRLLLSAIVLVTILGPIFGDWWKSPATILGGTLLTALMMLAWFNLEAVSARQSGSVLFLPLLLLTTSASVVLTLSGSLVLGQICGTLTAALGGCWLVSWKVPSLTLARGGTPIIVVTLASLFFNARFYAEAPRGSLELLALAPVVFWLLQLPPFRGRSRWLKSLIATMAMLVPVAVAVGLAVAAMPSYEY